MHGNPLPRTAHKATAAGEPLRTTPMDDIAEPSPHFVPGDFEAAGRIVSLPLSQPFNLANASSTLDHSTHVPYAVLLGEYHRLACNSPLLISPRVECQGRLRELNNALQRLSDTLYNPQQLGPETLPYGGGGYSPAPFFATATTAWTAPVQPTFQALNGDINWPSILPAYTGVADTNAVTPDAAIDPLRIADTASPPRTGMQPPRGPEKKTRRKKRARVAVSTP